jgi:mannitol/fructose-specific phosphotransferase system IIA component (Ntr-type)
MEIEKILLTDCIKICNAEDNKDAILKKIAGLAKLNPILNDISENTIYKALLDREKMGSTAIGSRIAIPHCRLKNIEDFVIGLVVVKNGINFDAIDKKDTFIFAFIIAPTTKQNEHIRLLSYISQYLRKQENIDKLLNSNDVESIKQSIIRHTIIPQEIKQPESHKLVTVIIQNEDKFDDILNVLTEIEGSNIVISEASNAGRYLYHMPLFSSFMQTDKNDFCRYITATVKNTQIKEMADNLSEIINNETGIMFYVQSLEYLEGSLEI